MSKIISYAFFVVTLIVMYSSDAHATPPPTDQPIQPSDQCITVVYWVTCEVEGHTQTQFQHREYECGATAIDKMCTVYERLTPLLGPDFGDYCRVTNVEINGGFYDFFDIIRLYCNDLVFN